MDEVFGDVEDLPGNTKARVKKVIEERLKVAPDQYGERLRRDLHGLWKLRVGDYRIVYQIDNGTVTVWGIRHRKNIYPTVKRRQD